MTVVLAAENYPGSVEKGREIRNLPDSSEDSWVNHAGTKMRRSPPFKRWKSIILHGIVTICMKRPQRHTP